MPVWGTNKTYVDKDKESKPFASQLDFGSLHGHSKAVVFDGSCGLAWDFEVRGVLESVEVLMSENDFYTGTEIGRVLNREGISGELEKRILEGLERG